MSSKIQSVLFKKSNWNTTKARNWLKKNKIKPMKRVHTTLNYYRYRILKPNDKRFYYRISNIKNKNIKLTIQYDKY